MNKLTIAQEDVILYLDRVGEQTQHRLTRYAGCNWVELRALIRLKYMMMANTPNTYKLTKSGELMARMITDARLSSPIVHHIPTNDARLKAYVKDRLNKH